MTEFTAYRRQLKELRDNKASFGKVNRHNIEVISNINHSMKELFHAMIRSQNVSYSELEKEFESSMS